MQGGLQATELPDPLPDGAHALIGSTLTSDEAEQTREFYKASGQ